MKGNKGVTLLTLIITIIILLILTGVAIATITGQNGVIENANKAIELAKQDEAKDQEIIDKVDEMFKKYIGQDEIDENAPILKLKAVSNEMLDERTSGNISEYFTYSENGVPITKVEYTTNGVTVDGNKTKALGGTITCTVTDQNGVSVTKSKHINYANGGNATEISNYAEIYYGRKITNYIAPNGDPDVNWQIYYADTEDNKIYLIGDRCVKNTYIPQEKGTYSLRFDQFIGEVNYLIYAESISEAYEGSISITDERIKKLISWIDSYPNSTNDNIKEVAYLLDTELWNEYYKDTIYGDFAIGGPTIELFCKSYKDTHPSRYIECEEINENGYKIKWSDDSEYKEENLDEIPIEVDYNKTFRNNEIYLDKMHPDPYDAACLISSPSSKGYVFGLSRDPENNGYISFESADVQTIIPVVCLQDNVNLVSNEDGTYELSK